MCIQYKFHTRLPSYVYTGAEIGGSRIAIDPKDIREGILIDKEFDEFIWGLEFLRDWLDTPKVDRACLTLKFRSDHSSTDSLVVGLVVSVGMLRKGSVMVTVENDVCQKWVKLELPSKNFSSKFNSEWLSSGEISVTSFGFFPKPVGVERLLAGVESMMVADIFSGFLYVKSQMLKDKGLFEIPAT